jgi:hypothetical protein
MFGEQQALRRERQRAQWRARLLELLRQRLFENAIGALPDGTIEARVEDVLAHRRDPYSVVEELVGDSRRARGKESKRTP